MNKKETDVLSKTIEAVSMVSDRLDTVFKAVEVIQKHIVEDKTPITYDTRIDMFKDKHSNNCKCDNCDVKDINRRIDRLEETVGVVVSLLNAHSEWLNRVNGSVKFANKMTEEMYEEQAARGDFIDESDQVEDDINF